jgi:hypothetical protein
MSHFIVDIFSETVQAIEIARFSAQVSGRSLESVRPKAEAFYKDYYQPIDKESFAALMGAFGEMIPSEYQPEYYKEQIAKYGDAMTWADSLFAQSAFADPAKMQKLGEDYHDVLLNDPASQFYLKMQNWALPHLSKARAINNELKLAYRTYMRGQMDFAPDRTVYYPDANLTLRVSYGHIKGYSPADGIYYHPSSTLTGIIEKDNPEIFDYNIPQHLRDIYAAKDFGRWSDENGEVPVCFIATNHTTGGNSGSPVMNSRGELIGLAFDGNKESLASDMLYTPHYNKCVCVDIRFILWTLDRYAGMTRIIEELHL